MSRRQIGSISLACSATLMLSGCIGDTVTVPSETLAAWYATDQMTCVAINDVYTTIVNADAGFREGRMTPEEQQGWYRLAARAPDRIPARAEGSVSDAVAALRNAAPPIALGDLGVSGISSSEWNNGLPGVLDTCASVDVEMSLEMFSGG